MSRDTKPTHPEAGSDLLDALVRAERADAPDPEAQDRTWEQVVGTVGLGAPPPLDPGSIAGPATGSSWIKLVSTVVLASGLAAAGVLGYRAVSEPDPVPVATTAAPAKVQPETPPPVAPPPPTSPVLAPPAVPATPTSAPPGPTPTRAEVSPSRPAPRTPASSLAEETRLIGQARAHVRADAPGKALAPLAEHARRFPDGQLNEDRMVLQAIARCDAGELAAGRRAAAALRAAFPASSHLPRVERACAG